MADNSNSSGAHYAVANSLWMCDKGVLPAQLQVMQNQTLIVQNQAVATDKEVTFNPPAQTFGVCSINPSVQTGQPCMYAKGQWNASTCYKSNDHNILTEDSEMLCSVFPPGGKITNVYHGQVASVSFPQLDAVEIDTVPSIMKDNTNDTPVEKKETKVNYFGVSKVKRIAREKDIVSYSEKEINVRKNEEITVVAFKGKESLLSAEENKYVSWIVSEKNEKEIEVEVKKNGKVDKKKTKEIIYLCDFFDKYKSPFNSFKCQFNKLGDFYIEGVGYPNPAGKKYNNQTYKKINDLKVKKEIEENVKNWKFDSNELKKHTGKTIPTDNDASLLVHVVENSIKFISVQEIDEKGTVVKKRQFKKTDEKNYYIKQGKKVKITAETLLKYDKGQEVVCCRVSQEDGTVPKEVYQYTDGNLEMTLDLVDAGVMYTIEFHMYRKLSNGSKEEDPLSSKSIFVHSYNEAIIQCTEIEWGDNVEGIEGAITKARPGTFFKFEVGRVDQTWDENLKNVDWEIWSKSSVGGKKLKTIEEKKDSDFINYKFDSVGVYEIVANLTDAKLSNGGVLGYEGQQIEDADVTKHIVTHTIEIKPNTVFNVKVKRTWSSRYFYVGVRYPIEIRYDYGEKTSWNEIRRTKITTDDGARIMENRYFLASTAKEYKVYAILNEKKCFSDTIKVIESQYEKWNFTNSKGDIINEIGWRRNDKKSYEFCIQIKVPAWGIAQEMMEKNSSVNVVLFTEDETFVKMFSSEISEEGEISIQNIRVDDIITELKKQSKLVKKDIKLFFCVYNAPVSNLKGGNGEIKEKKGGINVEGRSLNRGIYVEGCFLNIKYTLSVTGKFIDPNNDDTLMAIKKYGDEVKVRLHILNPGDKKLYLRVYENESVWDSKVFETSDFNIDEDGYADISIPTNEGNIKSSDHSGAEPRLFYFHVDVDLWGPDISVYSYPKSLCDYKFKASKKTIKNENNQVKSEARSYFEQLKLLPETENNEYCKTYASLVPAVVGDEGKKSDKKKIKKCYCYNGFSVDFVRKMILKLRGKDENAKLDAVWEGTNETKDLDCKTIDRLTRELNSCFDKYGISKCIQKIVFLAIAFQETQRFCHLEEQPNNHASSKSEYKGRGLLQMTGKDLYQRYNQKLRGDNVVKNPKLISTKIHYAVDSSCTFFTNRYFKSIPQWKQEATKKMWGGTEFLTLNKTALWIESEKAEKESLDYYRLICQLLNGVTISKKDKPLGDDPLGWSDRLSNYNKLKEIFGYNKKVCDEADLNVAQPLWHDPLDKMMSCYFSQSGYENPHNSIFCHRTSTGTNHPGVDLFAEPDSPVYACLSGYIREVSYTSASGGKIIYLRITDPEQIELFIQRKRNYKLLFKKEENNIYDEKGTDSLFDPQNGFTIIYMHLNEIFVNKGDVVSAGQIIGLSGRTGNAPNSKGPHVHFEIRSDLGMSPVGFKYHANPAYYVYFKQFKIVEEKLNGKKIKMLEVYNCDTCSTRTKCDKCIPVLIDKSEPKIDPKKGVKKESYSEVRYDDEDLELQRKVLLKMIELNDNLGLK